MKVSENFIQRKVGENLFTWSKLVELHSNKLSYVPFPDIHVEDITQYPRTMNLPGNRVIEDMINKLR